MAKDPQRVTVMICCSVFQAEVTALCKAYWPNLMLRFQSSMLHINPERLASRLNSLVEEQFKLGHQVVLIYGDCCEQMEALEALPRVVRTRGHNCYDLLLGHDKYRQLSNQGSFFLLPEWARRWQEVFEIELGLNHDNAASLMQDLHQKLIYLDTGIVPIPESALLACAKYCGLPCEVRPVTLELLRAAIQEALFRLEANGDLT